MRKLILQTGVSIDGYVAALDGSHPWGVDDREDDGVKRWILESESAAGAHLMGRVTYEEMASVWPTSTSDYARPMNEIPKVVFSKTLRHADWPETSIARAHDPACCTRRRVGALQGSSHSAATRARRGDDASDGHRNPRLPSAVTDRQRRRVPATQPAH